MTQTSCKKDKNVLHFIVFCIIAAMGWNLILFMF